MPFKSSKPFCRLRAALAALTARAFQKAAATRPSIETAHFRGVAAVGLGLLAGTSNGLADERPNDLAPADSLSFVSVEDVVRETVIGDPSTLNWNDTHDKDHVSVTSLDGRYIAVVLRNGNIEHQTNDGRLLVFDAATIMNNPEPRLAAAFSSATNFQPIALVRWLSDSRTLMFAATEGSQKSQIYKVHIDEKAIRTLTSESDQLTWYETNESGTRLVTLAQRALQRLDDDEDCQKRGCRVSAEKLYQAVAGYTSKLKMSTYDLGAGTQGSVPAPEDVYSNIESCNSELVGGISPDGRFTARVCNYFPHQWPTWWSEYTADPELQPLLADGNNREARKLFLIDLDHREVKSLTEAPFFWNQAAPVWIDGGQRVLLAGALESLAETNGRERERRAGQFVIISVELPSLKATRVALLDKEMARVTRAQWNPVTQELRVEAVDSHKKPLPAAIYRRVKGRSLYERVTTSDTRAAGKSKVTLFVDQSLNNPPVLKAIDPQTGHRCTVLDPNPWLNTRALARVEAIEWTTPGERKWRGGVYYPPGYQAGVRYPLVIQTHGFQQETFALSGIARNFVAQPLAGRGIVVLQMGENLRGVDSSPEQWTTIQAGVEGAIDALDARGVIDKKRVGIVGWSATGPQMGYIITHSEYSFVAGAFTDTGGHGLWWYLANGGSSSAIEMEADYGAKPFGEGLKAWLEATPGFNVDRVRTPLMMIESGSATGLWDWYGALRRLGAPVEYWVMPNGVHDVFKVGERLHANHLLVDWFDFWLNDHEDLSAADSEQYPRWRLLRKQQRVLLGIPRPPLLRWQATPRE
jgi:dipeptidyl aminopeptidase/acylaminoacyl peptidase